jgi:hypothetical protein
MYANPSLDLYTFRPDLEKYKFLICGVCRTIENMFFYPQKSGQ